MTFLLDTNVISELRKNEGANPSVVKWATSVRRAHLYTSVLVIGELRRGVELKRRSDTIQAGRLEKWLEGVVESFRDRILTIDDKVADVWSRMGVPDPVPDIDALIAATAAVHGLSLVTRDRVAAERLGITVVNPFVA